MISQLEKEYVETILSLDKNNFTNEQVEEEFQKIYRDYRGKLMDFRTLFFQEPNDVQFEVLFEKLMDSYLNYRLSGLVNSYRKLHKGFEPHLDDEGNIKDTEKYAEKSLTHKDDGLVSDDGEEE